MHSLDRHPNRPTDRHHAPDGRPLDGDFLGFPLGGFAAMLIAGPVDSTAAPRCSAACSPARSRRRPGVGARRRRRRASAVAWIVGHRRRPHGRPRVGAAAVDYRYQPARARHPGRHLRTRRRPAQALVLRASLGRLALVWPPVLAPDLGARLGGHHRRSASQVDEQFTVFGSSGAIVVTALTAVLPVSSASAATDRKRAHDPPRRLRHRPGRPPVVEQLVSAASTSSPSTAADAASSPAPTSSPATPPTRPSPRGSPPGADVVYFCLNATQLRPVGRGVPAAAARRARRGGGRRRPARRARQPVRLRPHRRPGPRRDHAGAADLDQGRHPGRDDRRTAARPRGRSRRGRDRPGVGLLRPGRRPLGAGRDRLRHRADRSHRAGHGQPRPAPQLLLHARRRRRRSITLGTQPERHRIGVAPARRRDPHHRADHRPRLRARRPEAAQLRRRTHHAWRCSGWSSRRCGSTCTRCTSSPTAGSSTTPSSAPRSATTATPLDDALATTLQWYRDARQVRDRRTGVPPIRRIRRSPTPASHPAKGQIHEHAHHPPPAAAGMAGAAGLSPSPASPHSDRSSTTRRS